MAKHFVITKYNNLVATLLIGTGRQTDGPGSYQKRDWFCQWSSHYYWHAHSKMRRIKGVEEKGKNGNKDKISYCTSMTTKKFQ